MTAHNTTQPLAKHRRDPKPPNKDREHHGHTRPLRGATIPTDPTPTLKQPLLQGPCSLQPATWPFLTRAGREHLEVGEDALGLGVELLGRVVDGRHDGLPAEWESVHFTGIILQRSLPMPGLGVTPATRV
jgi:hypothetical protein